MDERASEVHDWNLYAAVCARLHGGGSERALLSERDKRFFVRDSGPPDVTTTTP